VGNCQIDKLGSQAIFQPVRDLGAMVEIVMLVWRAGDDSAINTNRMRRS
jgi:hypothetical protein